MRMGRGERKKREKKLYVCVYGVRIEKGLGGGVETRRMRVFNSIMSHNSRKADSGIRGKGGKDRETAPVLGFLTSVVLTNYILYSAQSS